jgi:hypothetical protein
VIDGPHVEVARRRRWWRVRLGRRALHRVVFSRQFGRTSAPMIPDAGMASSRARWSDLQYTFDASFSLQGAPTILITGPTLAAVRSEVRRQHQHGRGGASAMPLDAHRHGAVPAPLSCAGRSCQFGRTSAPMIPHRVHTMRGPNDGTATSSGHGSALRWNAHTPWCVLAASSNRGAWR